MAKEITIPSRPTVRKIILRWLQEDPDFDFDRSPTYHKRWGHKPVYHVVPEFPDTRRVGLYLISKGYSKGDPAIMWIGNFRIAVYWDYGMHFKIL